MPLNKGCNDYDFINPLDNEEEEKKPKKSSKSS
jgi:hypothetical protein